MTADIATLGLALDSRQVVEGAKALDALAESSVRVEQRVKATNGQMADTAKIMAAQAEQARAAAAGNAALGASTNQLTLGQQLLIERYREQAATIGMSRTQLMAYQAAQMGVTAETAKAVAAVKAHEDAMRAATKAKEDAAKASNQLTDALKLLAAGYALLKVGEYIKDSALLAARYETMGVVLEVVGRNAGYTKTQMDAASDGIARQGITMLESRNSAVKLVQAHVDLSNASALARIAQDAAVIGNINSSEAFDRMVNGIARGNVLILRNIGLNVNLQSAYATAADSLGKTTKELTENERVQARLNAVLERGTDIAGTYEAAMGTAGKQILSMQRYTEDLKVKLGETFTEVLTVAVMAFTDHLKDSNHEVSELAKNGQLAEWGHDLTNVFVGVANAVDNILTGAKMAGAWAAHQSVGADINAKYDKMQATAPRKATLGGAMEQHDMIERERQAAFAAEQAQYEAAQITLAATVDRFQAAADSRAASRTAKIKADSDSRIKIDQDYATRAQALLTENAGKSLKIQQDAQVALYKSVYVGTPTFHDTEGRTPKPQADQAENTRLANQIARFESEASATKRHLDDLTRLDEMYHSAGELSDQQYFDNKRVYTADAAKAQIDAYQKEMDALVAHNNQTPAEVAKTQKQIDDIFDKQTAARERSAAEMIYLDEKERLRQKAIVSASDDMVNKYISGLNAQATALEAANAGREASRGSVERETVARLDLAIAIQKQTIADQDTYLMSDAQIAQGPKTLKYLEDQRAARERLAKGFDQQDADNFQKKMADQAIQDWQRAGSSIADSLKSAFGSGGKAIGEMFKAYSEGVAGQLKAQKDLAAAKKLSDENPEKIDAINRAHLNGAQSQLKSYGDMAGAAQGFFEQGSRGYQAMGAAAQVMHAAEVALSLVKGVNAVLTQGEGDPYSAFARMAAMAAVVVGLGVAISGGGGGGGGQSAADAQKAQGTGSVFGDIGVKNQATGVMEYAAKSASITRSIELSSANSSIELTHTAGMLASLRNIERSMTGLTNLVARTPGVVDGSNMGIQTGTLSSTGGSGTMALTGAAGLGVGLAVGATSGAILGNLGLAIAGPIGLLGGLLVGKLVSLWGSTKQDIVDSGLQFGGSVRDLESGKGYNQYASVDTTKSSWFGLSKSTSNSVQTQGISNELSSQFGMIFTNLEGALKSAAVAVGGNADDVSKALDSLTLDVSKVSLKGLTGSALTDALNGVLSKAMDQMAEAAMPQMDAFRKVGEGYAETVIRVATDYANLDSILQSGGMTFGAVGMASIAARENLIDLAGGIDKLASKSTFFNENFLTQAQRLAPVSAYVAEEMGKLGLASIDSRDKFRDLVLGINKADPAGQQLYVTLMGLEEAFAKTHAAAEDLTKSQQQIADERKTLQGQMDGLTMTSTQLRAKERDTIDQSNLALFDSITAEQKRSTAVAEASSILDQQGQMYAAMGDKAGSASVLEQQHAAALALMTPELAKATSATWAAQAVQKVIADATAQSNSLLSIQAQIYTLTGNAAGSASVLEQQHVAALLALDPALRGATEQLWAAQKAADQSKVWNTFASGLTATIQKATDAAKALRDFNTSLTLGSLSPLSAGNQYDIAKQQLMSAGPDNVQAAATAFLTSAKANDASRLAYAQDFAFTQSIIERGAAGQVSKADGIRQMATALSASSLFGSIGAHANGGIASGWSIVGEKGPELANFTSPARIYTAPQSRAMMGGDNSAAIAENSALLREVISELRSGNKDSKTVATILTRVTKDGNSLVTST